MLAVKKSEGNPALLESTGAKELLAYYARDVGAESRVCRGVGDLVAQYSQGGGDEAVVKTLPRAESEEIERIEVRVGRREGLTPISGRKRSSTRVVVFASLIQSASSSRLVCWYLICPGWSVLEQWHVASSIPLA